MKKHAILAGFWFFVLRLGLVQARPSGRRYTGTLLGP